MVRRSLCFPLPCPQMKKPNNCENTIRIGCAKLRGWSYPWHSSLAARSASEPCAWPLKLRCCTTTCRVASRTFKTLAMRCATPWLSGASCARWQSLAAGSTLLILKWRKALQYLQLLESCASFARCERTRPCLYYTLPFWLLLVLRCPWCSVSAVAWHWSSKPWTAWRVKIWPIWSRPSDNLLLRRLGFFKNASTQNILWVFVRGCELCIRSSFCSCDSSWRRPTASSSRGSRRPCPTSQRGRRPQWRQRPSSS
mmetsp:Transcript_74290/g.164055  ORF Transcript_74290/g.164055 Transcript_74290/m.164055 type:complete len:254 (+) Transcript_74290:279-1040(+)